MSLYSTEITRCDSWFLEYKLTRVNSIPHGCPWWILYNMILFWNIEASGPGGLILWNKQIYHIKLFCSTVNSISYCSFACRINVMIWQKCAKNCINLIGSYIIKSQQHELLIKFEWQAISSQWTGPMPRIMFSQLCVCWWPSTIRC